MTGVGSTFTQIPGHVVGRDAELRQIRDFLGAAGPAGDALLVVGEAGIGKSALLDAASRMAAADGAQVIRAAGAEFEAEISFAGLNQLIVPVLREARLEDPGQREALNVALGLQTGSSPSVLAVCNAVLGLLEQLARAAPVLVIVDDLPWLDRSSALVLGLVARRLSGIRACLIVAQRTDAGSFFENGGLPQLVLRPLDESSSTRLLGQHYPELSPAVRRRMLAEAQGNPLALTELPSMLAGAENATRIPVFCRSPES